MGHDIKRVCLHCLKEIKEEDDYIPVNKNGRDAAISMGFYYDAYAIHLTCIVLKERI